SFWRRDTIVVGRDCVSRGADEVDVLVCGRTAITVVLVVSVDAPVLVRGRGVLESRWTDGRSTIERCEEARFRGSECEPLVLDCGIASKTCCAVDGLPNDA